MASTRKNKALYIDKEALSVLELVKEGILYPVNRLMNKKEAEEVDKTGFFNGKHFPFSFILCPNGRRNIDVLKTARKGEVIDLVVDGIKKGEITTEETFKIDVQKRVEKIFGSADESHPGVLETLQRIGEWAICGEYWIDFEQTKQVRATIQQAKIKAEAKHTTAFMLAAKPFHRAHERLIRLALEKTDLLVLFLLKPFKRDYFAYELRYKILSYFVENYLPRNRVLIVPLENSYIFAGFSTVGLDSIAAKNFGCDRIIFGQNHTGIGMYYVDNKPVSMLGDYDDIDIEKEIVSEFVYCNKCSTIVSIKTCPHGNHHHISYHSKSLLEILKAGLLPPAVLIRKDISAMILSELFPGRFQNLGKIYDDIMPSSGLLESHDEKDFYLELMKLYQTASLT
jgi:sulfate adenylyltransferase